MQQEIAFRLQESINGTGMVLNTCRLFIGVSFPEGEVGRGGKAEYSVVWGVQLME